MFRRFALAPLFVLITTATLAQLESRADDNGKFGFQENGEWVIKPQYDEVEEFYQGPFARVAIKKKWGLIDQKGRVVVPLVYDGFLDSHERYYSSVKNKKYGVVDMQKGVVLVECLYDIDVTFESDLYAPALTAKVVKGGMAGVLDTLGHEIIPCVYDDTELPFESIAVGLFKAYQSGRAGVVDTRGKERVPFEFKDVYLSESGFKPLLITRAGKRYGAYSMEGKLLAKAEYDDEPYFGEDGFGVVMKQHRYGLIDLQGNLVLPVTYTSDDAMTEDREALRKKQ